MVSINTPDSGHAGPTNQLWTGDGGPHLFYFLPFANPSTLQTLNAAINIINTQIVGGAQINSAFQSLPGGRAFDDIWKDANVWVNYDTDNTGHWGGYTGDTGTDFTVCDFTLRIGRWLTAAVIMHELAHINGATDDGQQADSVLYSCGLGGLTYDVLHGQFLQVGSSSNVPPPSDDQ